ncbi:TPA: DUF1493 family protein, partial [Klebsiella pneumoniae]|nr:DUF1493 family protein [Mycobacterium tuberculosis]HBZ5225467.1 DUF1493 family protein [Klebsiella pneumoniae]
MFAESAKAGKWLYD